MRWRLLFLVLALAALLTAPWVVRAASADARRGRPAPQGSGPVERLVVLTPHNEQIRSEFGAAFADHCLTTLRRRVEIDWRAPGGTTEIRRLLEAQITRAIKTGRVQPDGACDPGALSFDILFGGGAYEHEVVKKGVTVEVGGAKVTVSMSVPAPFDQAQLDEWFGENTIGPGRIYDPDRQWLGSALTAFGIGFNRDALRRLGLPEPRRWEDLCDRRYAGWLALSDPRQSGSVATTYDAILNAYGWERGWRVLRGMSANARFFAASSLKPPIEISRGEAAAGPVLDFYGRYQMSVLRASGAEGRNAEGRDGESRSAGSDSEGLGYIDPPGEVFIDSDPITILRGGPNPDLAARFVEFVLSEQGQALWQFATDSGVEAAPVAGQPPYLRGTQRFELHRMPVRRVMYEKHAARFVDKDLNPYSAASMAPLRGWRYLIDKMMACFAMDIHDEMRLAWGAIGAVRDRGDGALADELEEAFFAFPPHRLADGKEVAFTAENFKAIRDDWRDANREPEIRMAYTRFFREQYAEIVRRSHRGAGAAAR